MARPSSPLRVLVVEDEALLAMDIEATVEDCGHRVIGGGASLFDVQGLARDAAPDFTPDLALVDIQLACGTSGLDVCVLIRRRWPNATVVFVTANPKKIPDDFAGGHGVIPKPFSRNGLMSAVRYIVEAVTDPPPSGGVPPSFTAAPALSASWR